MKKIIILHAGLLVVLIAVGIFGYFRFWNAATVNGTPISRISYIKAMEKLGGRQTLDSMIDEVLILNEGIAKSVKIDQKVIDDEIAKIEAQLKTQGQTLDAALLANGMTKADLEKQIRVKKIEGILSAPTTEITQAQIDEFLTANKSMLPTGKTKVELQTLAKEQLALEANQTAATTWFDNLRQSAKIVYR
ncbi:MAG: SurA N-terminal domain-containing protein [Candidatus Shapirobacteria bacterium]